MNNLVPPSVNQSTDSFIQVNNAVCCPLTMIKALSSLSISLITEERERNGPFLSLFNFVERLRSACFAPKELEALIDAGAFDWTKWRRDQLRVAAPHILEIVEREGRNEVDSITVYSMLDDEADDRFARPPTVPTPSSAAEDLFREKEATGFFLTGHPLDEMAGVTQRLSCVPLSRIDEIDDTRSFRAAFVVDSVSLDKGLNWFVSDGTASRRISIPVAIWDSFETEEIERRMLYGVLTLGKDRSLTCTWMCALSNLDEEKITQSEHVLQGVEAPEKGRSTQ